jgi:hypothetical protein
MHSNGAIATRLIALAMLAAPLPARGAAGLKVGEDGSFSAGLGLRTRRGRSAPDGSTTSNEFSVENARLYLGGSWAKIFHVQGQPRGGAARRHRAARARSAAAVLA